MNGESVNIMKSPLRYAIENAKLRRGECKSVIEDCSVITPIKRSRAATHYWQLLAFLALLGIGCTGATPEIIEVRSSLVYRYEPQRSFATEELSLFARVSDDDGVDDIQYIYLIHDDLEIYWTLTEQSWQRLTYDESEWFGSSTLRMADEIYIPRGRFRLEVVDYGGKRAQSYFSIPQHLPIDQINDTLPNLERREFSLYLISQYTDNIVYRRYPNEENEKLYEGGEGLVSEDEAGSSAEYWIYSFLDDNETLILRGPLQIE